MLAALLSCAASVQAADKTVCQGYAMVGYQLKQLMLQGTEPARAVELVLDDTTEAGQRAQARAIVSNTATIVAALPLQAATTRDFLLLSCLDGGMFDGPAARAAYLERLPTFVAASTRCEQDAADSAALQKCMVRVFTLPANGQ